MHDRRRVGRMIFGIVLMAAGSILLLGRLDLMDVRPFGHLWPLALIVIGLGKLYQTWGTLQSGSGLWMLFTGLWFLAVNFRIYGLTIQNSWPVLLVISGLTMLCKSYFTTRAARGI